MIRILLSLAIAASLGACSDDTSTSDLGPLDQGPSGPDLPAGCPATKPDDASSCTRESTDLPCEYLIERCPCGPSDIEWHCSCDSGSWSCSRDYDCYPCPDGAIDSGTDTGTTFACGAEKSCKIGEEYCMKITPGACGGDPVPDSGVCPPDCQPTTCGGTEQYCLCLSYACTALPSECSSCSCLGISGACTCSDNGGAIQVSCAAL